MYFHRLQTNYQYRRTNVRVLHEHNIQCTSTDYKLITNTVKPICVHISTESEHTKESIPKTIKFELLPCYACTAFANAWFLATFKKCEIQTYRYTHRHVHTHRYTHTHTHTQTDYCMPSAHVHQGIKISFTSHQVQYMSAD